MTFPSFHILRFSPLVSVRSYKYSCTLYYCVSFRYLPVLVPPFSIFIFSSLALQFFSTHFFFVLSCFLVPQFSLRPPFFFHFYLFSRSFSLFLPLFTSFFLFSDFPLPEFASRSFQLLYTRAFSCLLLSFLLFRFISHSTRILS